MSYSGIQTVCDLPPEIFLQVAHHLSFSDHNRWILADKRHRDCLSSVLYLRLLPFRVDSPDPGGDSAQRTRRDVVRWAVEHGRVCTLRLIDEVEDIVPFVNTMLVPRTDGPDMTLMHQAALCGHTSVIEYLLQKGANVNASTAHGLLPTHLAKTGAVVHMLAEHGGRLNADAITPAGVTTLSSSIHHQCDPSAVAAFLQLGADPNHVAQDGTSAAEVAVAKGNADALGLLLDAGVEVNKPLASGGFLLYKAMWLGTRDHSPKVTKKMATMLLDRGASPNCGLHENLDPHYNNEPCFTPVLFLAVMMPCPADLVQLLLERGADLNKPYTRYRRPFYHPQKQLRGFEQTHHQSLVANLFDTMINSGPYPPPPESFTKLKILVEYGGDIDTMLRGQTLLQYSLCQTGTRAVKALDVIQPLVALGADVTRVDSEDNSTLHLLCKSLFQQVQRHWDYSRSVWCTTLLRPSPLCSLIDVLIEHGADPTSKDAQGRTPLMLLCRHNHTVPTALLMKALLRHTSLNVQAIDNRGFNALHYATGEPTDPFHHEPCFRLLVLLTRGKGLGVEDVNAYNDSGRTPLHLVLEAPNTESRDEEETPDQRIENKARAIVMLIRAGADVRARTRASTNASTPSAAGDGGETPLHLALQGDQHEMRLITEILLRHGAAGDVNYVSPTLGLTPLLMVVAAAGRGELSRNMTEDMIRLLLEAGADPQTRDTRGRTAWEIFVELNGVPWIISPWALCLERLTPRN